MVKDCKGEDRVEGNRQNMDKKFQWKIERVWATSQVEVVRDDVTNDCKREDKGKRQAKQSKKGRKCERKSVHEYAKVGENLLWAGSPYEITRTISLGEDPCPLGITRALI